MTTPASARAVQEAREHALTSWYWFTESRNFQARIPDWRTSIAPDGSPVVSAEVAGPGAAHALARFAAEYYLNLPHAGDMRPQFDIEATDRTVLVWRRDGVWVELWHPDTVQAAPEPVQVVPADDTALVSALSRRPLLGPGGRLTFTRRKKETTRA